MNIYCVAGVPYSDELYHHGIKGQKWYIRRFQNEDGSLTPAGRERYLGNRKNLEKDLNRLEQGYRRSAMNAILATLRDKVIEDERKHIYQKVTGDPDTNQDISDKISRKDAARLDRISKEALKLATTKEMSGREVDEYKKQIWQLICTAIEQGNAVVGIRGDEPYYGRKIESAALVGLTTIGLNSLPIGTIYAIAGNVPMALSTYLAGLGSSAAVLLNDAYVLKHYGGRPYVYTNTYAVVDRKEADFDYNLEVEGSTDPHAWAGYVNPADMLRK